MRLTVCSGVLLVVLAGGLTGCSASGSVDSSAGDDPTPTAGAETSASPSAMAGAPLAKVTTEDYEVAVGQLDECLKKVGVELINDGWDPVDNERMLLRYKSPGMSFERGDQLYQNCVNAHLKPVEDRYNQDNKAHMEPALMAAVQDCVRGKGISLSGREDNPADLLAAVPETSRQALRDCVRESVSKVYPNLYATSFP